MQSHEESDAPIPEPLHACASGPPHEARPHTDFHTLFAQAQAGHEPSRRRLCETYLGRLHGRIRARLRGAARVRYDTADIRQSVLVKLIDALPELEDRGERAFVNWLYTTAENSIRAKGRRLANPTVDRLRDAFSRRARLLDDAGDFDPLRGLIRSERAARVRTVTAQMSAGAREILRLRVDAGLPFAEIAEQLGLASADAARKRFVRALARFADGWQS